MIPGLTSKLSIYLTSQQLHCDWSLAKLSSSRHH